MSKYGNVKTDGYDSKAEAFRGYELELLERAGKIQNLGKQVKFEVIPRQLDEFGRILEREAYYKVDFVYEDMATGKTVIEDVKGVKTQAYILKRKLMLQVHGIRINEVP